jgi:redox-sensitive bicupin YhaK (pirin superfamily)
MLPNIALPIKPHGPEAAPRGETTMMEIRKSNERGVADLGWLQSRHSFSFGHYRDPDHVGFGPLLVINEDRVQPGRGFGTHGHRDMEIISYVLDGALEHKDNMGNGSTLRYGDVQRLSAGTGVMHSEFNHAQDKPVHFLQIWIQPNVKGIPPGYEERHFDAASKQGRLRLIASPDGHDGSVRIHQDARLYASILNSDGTLTHALSPGRIAYVHVIRGEITVNGHTLTGGDALKIAQEDSAKLSDARNAEILLFDLPH